MGDPKRVRVVEGISGSTRLDVSPEDIEWPDGNDHILEVSDVFYILREDCVYTDLCRGQTTDNNAWQRTSDWIGDMSTH